MPLLTNPNPNASRDDAISLCNAFNGSVCDIPEVIHILARRNDEQRDHIRCEYQAMYGKDIVELLASELSGDLKNAVLLWVPNSIERDAKLIRDSLTTAVLRPKPANEVICSRPASMIKKIKKCYRSKFGTKLVNDIQHYTSGDHRTILRALVAARQCKAPEVDGMAAEDAVALYKARERRTRTDTFIGIFGKGSTPHLARVAIAYEKMYETPLKQVIDKKMSGNFRQCLSIILKCAENHVEYFAEELHKSMNRMVTNDSALIRIIVSRAEIDLPAIKAEYEKKYKKPLVDAVYSDTTGYYREFLLALVREAI